MGTSCCSDLQLPRVLFPTYMLIQNADDPMTNSWHSAVAPRQCGRVLLRYTVPWLAAALVYPGDALAWPHVNRRAGYPGTEFLRSFLYAVNDPYAIHIVAAMWFGYGILLTSVLRLICRRCSQ